MDLDEEPPLGPDGDLAAAMISSSVTGIITNAAQKGVYDVYSLRQTRRLTDLIDMTGEFIGRTGQKYRVSIKARRITSMLNSCILGYIASHSELLRRRCPGL